MNRRKKVIYENRLLFFYLKFKTYLNENNISFFILCFNVLLNYLFGVKCQEDSNISVTNPIEKIT